MKVTILGCGASPGVPEIGCHCAVCRSDNPRNKRLRASLHVETRGKRLLIDTSPDLRVQALSNGIEDIDAVIYTHDHADHTHGIDDLRIFNVRKGTTIPVYGDQTTLAALQNKFAYAFLPKPTRAWYRPALDAREIPAPLQPFQVLEVPILPILQHHAESSTLGFRIDDFAYSTDTNGFPDESWPKLEGLKLWIVDCLRYTPSYTHSRLELTLQWVEKLKPELTVLTHMSHDMDYETLSKELPAGVVAAYDGMSFEMPDLFFP